MKKIIFAILALIISLNFGCKTNNSNLSIQVKDTNTKYTYNAKYPANKTARLAEYFAKHTNIKLPLSQATDRIVILRGGEKFKLSATDGVLSIRFDKTDNQQTAYGEIKKLTAGISDILKAN